MKLCKRVVALLFSVVMLLCLTACDTSDNNSDNDNKTTSHPGYEEFDTDSRLLIADNRNIRLLVLDLDSDDPTNPESYFWEWSPKPELGWKLSHMIKGGFSGGRLRWSEYYQSYVILVWAADNWVGIIEYPSGKALWEQEVKSAPHNVEMLPNGDIVVAGSGGNTWAADGRLMYFTITEGDDWKMTDDIHAPGAHGALWDPEQEVLWELDYYALKAYTVDYDAEGGPKFVLKEGMGARLPNQSGHALAVDYSDPNYLWVSGGRCVYKFSKSENKMLREYPYSEYLLSQAHVKSIATFKDGTLAYYYAKSSTEFDNDGTFFAIRPSNEEGKAAEKIPYKTQDNALWMCMSNFNPDYQ